MQTDARSDIKIGRFEGEPMTEDDLSDLALLPTTQVSVRRPFGNVRRPPDFGRVGPPPTQPPSELEARAVHAIYCAAPF